MIKYDNNTIAGWYKDGSELIKVYKNGAVCYYKAVQGDTGQTPCFAVVDDITQYSETEFVDVYDKTTDKWYKLNNLDQYEEYGVYGSGRNITCYEGKLTIDNGYEYEYSGGSWVNIGEVSGGSRVPQGYTEVEYVENTSSAYTETDFYPTQNTRVVAEFQASEILNNPRMFGAGAYNGLGFIGNIENLNNSGVYYFKYGNTNTWYHTNVSADTNKHKFDLNKNEYYIDDVLGGTAATTSFTMTYHLGIFNAPNKTSGTGAFTLGECFKGKCYSLKVYESDVLVRDFVPCINPSNVVGFYDVVNDTFYGSANNYAFVAGSTKIVYPKYYTEKDEPENDVVFTDMEEALAYQCPWVGMHAYIGGDKYIFTSGYTWEIIPLPYDAEIEYLESTGSQHINTGVYVDRVKFEIGYTVAGKGGQFGFVHQNVPGGTWMSVDETNAFFGNWYSSNKVTISAYTSPVETTVKYTNTGVTVNGTTISKSMSLVGTDNPSLYELPIFAWYDFYRGGIEYKFNSKFKSFYVKTNGELVLDMIPVRVGQVGYMYDRVSGELFGNDGTGSFILGADKN